MKAETKSLIAFLIMYLGSITLLFVAVGYLYFINEKARFVNEMEKTLQNKVHRIETRLEHDYQHRHKEINVDSEGDDIAFYDVDGEMVAATFTTPVNLLLPFSQENNRVTLIEKIPEYYFGIKYIVIRAEIPDSYMNAILLDIYLVAGYGLLFLLFVAMLLSRIMLRPLKDSIALLNRFIKDTTHEMNTPVSTILMSYEHMNKKSLDEKQLRSLNRMEIAAKTLSSLYDDLTFVAFHDYLEHHDETIELRALVEERIHYFSSWLRLKNITISCDLHTRIVKIDRKKIIRVIDNLLSNAIKYSKYGGRIEVTLNDRFFSVKDYGIGIPVKKQKKIFERFERASDAEGGFGIGLDIVTQVCKEYDIKLKLKSKESEGSEFKLIWPK